MKSGFPRILLPALLAAAGLLAGLAADRFLAISFEDKLYPDESAPPAREVPAPEVLPPFSAIVLPAGTLEQEKYRIAARELSGAIAFRTGRTPDVTDARRSPAGGRIIHVEATPVDGAEREGFALRGDAGTVRISGESDAGTVYGMMQLADLLYAGVTNAALMEIDTAAAPAMPYRFVDMGGVGIYPDTAAWRQRDYSHNSRAFMRAVRADPPFVDQQGMDGAAAQFRAYLGRMVSYGYNGVVAKGFLEFVNFDGVGDGFEVYGPDSRYRQRHLALRDAFGALFEYARDLGISVVLNTDMLALSRPLQEYFDRRFGGIDTADPAFWDVYAAGLAELFEAFPSVDGVMIRIGEAGAVYNLDGWNYFSTLDVRTDAAVESMLRAFTGVAADYGKTIYFRSWTVGVGEVGDLHTNPETYERVLGSFTAPNLVVSTKFVAGDFYSFLPINPTLFTGGHARMVELQARREFEVFASFPAFLGPVHQRGLQEITKRNDHVRSLWVWTQEGGPLRSGPMSLYPFHGFWELIDADVYAAARLAWNPDVDITAITRAWVRRMFGGDPHVVNTLAELMLISREAVLKGLYVGTFARKDVRALGLDPPPMMWIFEWDIVTSSSAVLSAMYFVSREDIEDAVAEGFDAVEIVREMQALAHAIDPGATTRPETVRKLQASLTYEENLLLTLAWYRAAFLYYYRWLDTGSRAAYKEWMSARAEFEGARAAHVGTYGDDLDFRAFSFFDADAGLAHMQRSRAMGWIARAILAMIVLTFLTGCPPVRDRIRIPIGTGGFQALWNAVTAPWRPAGASGTTAADRMIASVWALVLAAAAWLALSSFLSPTLFFVVGLCAATAAGPYLLLNRDRPFLPVWGSITGPMLLIAAIVLPAVALRGPMYFWYQFWMAEGFRIGIITAAVVAVGWGWAVLYYTQRALGRPAATAAGRVLIVAGGPLLALGTLAALMGLEQSLTALNNELVLLPLGLSEILGITTHLNIPSSVPFYVAGTGAVLMLAGLLLEAAEFLRLRRSAGQLAISRPAF